MIHEPKLTIGMSVFNPDRHFRSAIISLVNQSFQDWELILINDGSKNDLYDLIGDLIDSRFIILQDGINKGLAPRLNECIGMARGKYFARMDADDISYSDRFEKQVAHLDKVAALDLLATKALVIGEDNIAKGILPYRGSHQELVTNPWIGIYMPHPTWMGRVDWFKKFLYSNPAPHFSEDQELLLRAHRESHYETLDEILLAYRVRDSIDENKLLKTRRAILRFQLNYFWSNRNFLQCGLSLFVYFIKRSRDFFRLKIASEGCSKFQLPNNEDLATWKSICSTAPNKI